MADSESLSTNEKEMPFHAHFVELRQRLLKSVAAVGVGTLVCFPFATKFFAFLSAPVYNALPEESRQLIFLNPVEPFFVYLKLGVLAGFILASPFVFFQIWRFIAPGLYAHERRSLIPLVFWSTVTFMIGALFCYFGVLPFGLQALIGAGMTEEFAATAQISMAAYYDLIIRLIAAFGIVFEMPIFSYFLTKLGVITYRTLTKHWRIAVVMIFTVAAILTPPDVLTQILLGIPMCLLYGVSIWVSKAAGRRNEAISDEMDGTAAT